MSAPAPAPASPLLFRTELSIRWRDLDAFNHVNNAIYLRYLEEARLRWLLTLEGPWMDENVAPVVASALLNFKRPIAWPGDVTVELFVDRIGNSSFTLGHRIGSAKDPSALHCDGHIVMVWFDKRSGKSSPLPESVRTACASA
jgi:acyl-CoA thioester hydrolase